MLKLEENKGYEMLLIIFYLDFIVTDNCQFRKAPEGSPRKNAAQKQVLEAMSHRVHIDSSMELIGQLLFGLEKGPEVLKAVRPAGLPLLDNWDCLKTMVLFPMIQLHLFLMLI